jgi:hypothetical protein
VTLKDYELPGKADHMYVRLTWQFGEGPPM